MSSDVKMRGEIRCFLMCMMLISKKVSSSCYGPSWIFLGNCQIYPPWYNRRNYLFKRNSDIMSHYCPVDIYALFIDKQ